MGSICLPFNRPRRTDHITWTLYVPWDYHFISRSQGTINHNISWTFTFSSVIKCQLTQMGLHVFPSTNQIELTRLQKPSRSPGTIISSPDPKSDKQLWRYWSLYKKMSKNSIFSALVLIFTTRGHLIQKLCAPLKLAHQYASFATLQSQIWWTIMEILESKYKNIKKTVK